MALLKEVTYEQKNALADLMKQWAVNEDLGTDFILVRKYLTTGTSIRVQTVSLNFL